MEENSKGMKYKLCHLSKEPYVICYCQWRKIKTGNYGQWGWEVANNQTIKDLKCQLIDFGIYLEDYVYIQFQHLRSCVKNNVKIRAKQLCSWKSIDIIYSHIIRFKLAQAGVVKWIEHRPTNERISVLIPRQGACLSCILGLQ